MCWSLYQLPEESIRLFSCLMLHRVRQPVALTAAVLLGAHFGYFWTENDKIQFCHLRSEDLLTATHANRPAPLSFISNQLCPVRM